MHSHSQTLISSGVSTLRQRSALRLLALFGWQVNFAPLPGPRGVVIFYPHTSNWDFVIGILAKWAIGIPVHWLGKEALFCGLSGALFGSLMRSWGGEPIERRAATGAIERMAQHILRSDSYWLALAPEGTRKYREHWRSGFYHLALAAKVPLGLAYIDYATRRIGLVDYVDVTGNVGADLARIRSAYEDCRGRKPECAAPIVLYIAERERRNSR
jgi:1-acyl-sn-glycerol-3-phosphate acyltransferase